MRDVGGRLPEPGAAPTPRRPAPTRRHLVVGLALLAVGSALGVGVARWQAAGPAVDAPSGPPALSATSSDSARAVGGAATAPGPGALASAAPASAPSPKAAAGVPQLDASEMLVARGLNVEWRLARLRGNPQVLVLEFPGLADQGAAMNRAAAFVEKNGAPRDRVLGDGELQALIERQGDNPQTFFQGHDYSGDHLAEFFTVARRQHVRLNAHEQRLVQLLLDHRMLDAAGDGYVALGLQAIVTFTGMQLDDPRTPQDEAIDARRRESVLMHEISHGLFFTSSAYRDHCWQFWRQRLSKAERTAFRRLLANLNYDPGNEELMVNEMQALLMHTPDARAFSAASLGLREAQLVDLRARFRKGWTPR